MLGSGSIFESPAVVAGLDDVAGMGEPVEQGRRHVGVTEHGRPSRPIGSKRWLAPQLYRQDQASA
jgi:hypothetical protein